MERLLIALLLLLAIPLEADIVTLKDGTQVEGRVKRTAEGYVITDAKGVEKFVDASDVSSVELKKSGGTPAGAEEGLASLRRSVEAISDPAQALQRYQSFLAQNAGTPSAAAARQDMAQWQERVDKGLTKVGDRWVSREQLAELQSGGNAAAQQIAPAMQANPAAAAAMVDKALSANPGSPALLYLKGVVLFRQNQLMAARKSFETVAAAFPQHAPTHNNLAVILYQTHSQMPALLEYDKAMLADPANRQILDNVAEALHALPQSMAKNDLTKKVAADFNEQDAVLQSKMAGQGLKRLGSQWVSEADFANAQAAQAAQAGAQQKLDSYRNTAVALQARLQEIDQQIAADQQAMSLISQQSMQQNRGGRGGQQVAPPQRYYELQQQVQTLTMERDAKQRELQQLPRPDSQVQQTPTTGPSFAGKQSIFDERSLPGVASSQPATQP